MTCVRMEKFKPLKDVTEQNNLIARGIVLAHKSDKITINKPVVLLEGLDDIPVYSVFIDKNSVDFKDCNGCINVEKCHSILKKEMKSKFITILDSDFKRLNGGTLVKDANLFYTDYHDSELQMLFNRKVVKTVFGKFAVGHRFEDVVLQAEYELYNLSMAKWFNMKRHLKFKEGNPDLVNLSVGGQMSVNMVLQYFEPTPQSQRSFPLRSFTEFLIHNGKQDLHQLTNGHDLIARMAGIFKHKYNRQVSNAKLRESVCNAFTLDIAKKSQLYANVQKWCDKEYVQILK